MKRILIALAAGMFVITSCEKEELKPSKPNTQDQLMDCKKCDGTWDITDSIP